MARQLRFGKDARRRLKVGTDNLAQAVRNTLGPKGRNVALDKKWGAPTVTHDGVTVAKEIELSDPFENMGAQLLKEAATKTNDVAGDGTTTATVLAQAIVNEGLKNVAAGANPMLLKRGIELAAGAVVDSICRNSIEDLGLVVIGTGAATETELKEKKHRVEDALSANRAAVEEGVAPGGGVALLDAIEAIKDLKDDDPDNNTGISIVRRAMEVSMRQIALNAGKDGAVIINEVRRRRSEGGFIGYNVMTEAYEDMLGSGIIDPANVTRSAVQNAASIAAMILTTDVLIADIPEPQSAMPTGGMGDMGGMM